ncbi:ATP-binding protein [Neptunomonas phycophila]|uniref:histidine kinase n=1 Tax=Neptunomonas phycophila TaxID=1572645 RepID=A0AAW7XEQ5_9GAMM|nr:Hpt domain-containing protein [Neptunomonas phycophila]MDO6452052.1 ATP-binding protein [Neptunomonas phycophila]
MIERIFGKQSSIARIAIGQISIVISMVMVAALLGLFPDVSNSTRLHRVTLAETIAANGSIFITRSDLQRMNATLEVTVSRNEELLSAGVRRKDGRLMVDVGDHSQVWEPLENDISSDTEIMVPIWEGSTQWGQIELRFTPIEHEGIIGFLYKPVVLFTQFLALGCFVLFFWYLRRMLKQLDPSQAIPDRVKSALDTMAEGLLVMDVKQNIVLANHAFATLSNMPAEKLVGVKADIFPWSLPEDAEFSDLPWSRALASGDPLINSIVKLELPDQPKRTFMVNCSPVLLPGGKVGGVLVSLDDVTALEEKEIELRRSKDEAEQANRAKSDFLANMSHEIRTPMNAILGFTELLRRDRNGLEPDQQKHLNTISSSGEHLLNLINDILDLSKVESGHLDVESIDCKPAQLIQQVLQAMKVKADEKGLALIFEADTALPSQILTDPGRVRQILTNLIGNAIKFTDTGSVTVNVSVLNNAVPQLKISVNDTGIGMTEQQVNSVFDPFVQADSSITRRFGGTGLGLSISQKFAHALGGDIEVSSVMGQGSCFALILDVVVADDAVIEWIQPEQVLVSLDDTSHQEGTRWQFKPANILVVDDGNENRELLQLVLEDYGFTITTGIHGQEGLEKSLAESFDVILMDVQMPVMDGYTAVKAMREAGLTQPIIALTAHAMKGIEARCLEAGYSHYMTKPINIDELLATLADLLGATQSDSTDTLAEVNTNTATPEQVSQPTALSGSMAPLISTLATHERFAGLIKRFTDKLPSQVSAMEHALNTHRFDDLADLAHWLKGSAGSVGFADFTEPAKELELAAKAKDYSNANAHLEQISVLVKRAKMGVGSVSEQTAPVSTNHNIAKTPIKTAGLAKTHPKYQAISHQVTQRLQEHMLLMHAGLEAHNSEPLKEGAVWILSTASSLGYADLIQHAEDLKRAADADNREGQIQAFMHLKSSVLKLDGVDTQHLIDALKLTDDNVGENELAHKIHSSLLAKNEKFRPIVERFVTRLSEQVGLMQSALAEQDFKTLAELAHWLKGSAGSVGFDEFTELAEELENCSKSRDEKAAEHALSMIAHMAKHIDLD